MSCKKIAVLAVSLCLLGYAGFAASSNSGTAAFVEGCKAYSQGDWTTAVFMLKKAVAYPENSTPDSYFMLISSEINGGQDKGALDDCDFYLENFKDSVYYPMVQFYKGKILYTLCEYDKSIITLGDFCHQNEKSDFYPTALFYIGESLYAGYRYEEARPIYERIVEEYPDCPKKPDAVFRLESISQRQREEKLLYLLKQTGEEYLSAKEEYERQLRLYNSEAIDSTRQKLAAAQTKNESLEKQVSELEMQVAALKSNKEESDRIIQELREAGEKDIPAPEPFDEKKYQLKLLKEKALEAQKMLDEKMLSAGAEGK